MAGKRRHHCNCHVHVHHAGPAEHLSSDLPDTGYMTRRMQLYKHREITHKYFKLTYLSKFTADHRFHQDNPFTINSYQYLCVCECVLRACLDSRHGPWFCFPVLYPEIGKEARACQVHVYKGVKGGAAYPSAVSNLCIRQGIEDVCREYKVYSACPRSPGRAQRTSMLLPTYLVCLSALSTGCSSWQSAQLVATMGHVLWLPMLPRLGFFGEKSIWLGQQKRCIHAPGVWCFSVFCRASVPGNF